MLTESVSDPRRANWLTITSMSEDVFWPEEPCTARPNWELEAEVLRLTTRLMMRERELRQVKAQLKTQASKAQQQVASWRKRMEEKDEQVKKILVQKDAEMQNIMSQLLLFEAELRREQSRIEDLLSEKDVQIVVQQKEISRLKTCIDANYDTAGRVVDDYGSASDCASPSNSSINGNHQFNYGSASDCASSSNSINGNHHFYHRSASDCASSSNSINGNHSSYNSASSASSLDRRCSDSSFSSSRKSGVEPIRSNQYQRQTSHSESELISRAIFTDSSSVQSMEAVQKLKDGLDKFRGIQDVTNVHAADASYEASEKKRTPYKAPQKMKDLKAKRLNGQKVYRPVINEIIGQAVL